MCEWVWVTFIVIVEILFAVFSTSVHFLCESRISGIYVNQICQTLFPSAFVLLTPHFWLSYINCDDSISALWWLGLSCCMAYTSKAPFCLCLPCTLNGLSWRLKKIKSRQQAKDVCTYVQGYVQAIISLKRLHHNEMEKVQMLHGMTVIIFYFQVLSSFAVLECFLTKEKTPNTRFVITFC